VNRLKLLLDLEEMFDDLNGTAIVDLEDLGSQILGHFSRERIKYGQIF